MGSHEDALRSTGQSHRTAKRVESVNAAREPTDPEKPLVMFEAVYARIV
jgi:hypothetical protein